MIFEKMNDGSGCMAIKFSKEEIALLNKRPFFIFDTANANKFLHELMAVSTEMRFSLVKDNPELNQPLTQGKAEIDVK